MNIQNFIKLIIFVLLMCAGQILFKKTAIAVSKKTQRLEISDGFIAIILSIVSINYFYLALIIYGIATFYWLYLLQTIPLTMAYPFTALAMVIIPVASYYFFDEQLNDIYWVGAILIFMGIIIISFSNKP